MENEIINIVDQERKPIGVATRKEIHKYGYWHETFHCWFVSVEAETQYILLQKKLMKSQLKVLR